MRCRTIKRKLSARTAAESAKSVKIKSGAIKHIKLGENASKNNPNMNANTPGYLKAPPVVRRCRYYINQDLKRLYTSLNF